MSGLDRAFGLLENAAVAGVRCPQREQIPSHMFSQLAREGLIFVEVYKLNFRRVTILAGKHKGKKTADAPPDIKGVPAKPYLTVGSEGTRRNGKLIDTGWQARPQPSLKDYSRGA